MRLQVPQAQSDQGPLGGDLLQAAQPEPGEADGAFDDPDHGFDGLLAQFVEGFAIFGLQPGPQGNPPRLG